MPIMTSDQPPDEPIKLILMGESGVGKTGALCSLATAGYKLRILDLDNGVPIIRGMLTAESSTYHKQNPLANENVRHITLTAKKRKFGEGVIASQDGRVWERIVDIILGSWKHTDKANPENSYDLGAVKSWGTDTILVLDSLTSAAEAAHDYHLAMNGFLGAVRDGYNGQKDIGEAQRKIDSLLQAIKDTDIKCHVIVIAHVDYVATREDKEVTKGYPKSIGKAIAHLIPRHFNTMLEVVQIPGGRRKIRCQSTGNTALKTTVPLKLPPELPLETGLADIFKVIRGK